MYSVLHRVQRKLSNQPNKSNGNNIGTTFTMKKPFGLKTSRLLSGFSDTFGHCSDEEKVQLLSVLAQNSFGDDESVSSSDESFGCRSHDVSSDESSSACEQQQDTNHEPTPCDPANVSQTNDAILLQLQPKTSDNIKKHSPFKSKQNVINPQDEQPEMPDPNSDKLEWTFTLYDFDGKGMVTKEDIGSLVRSMQEVLGNSKFPSYKRNSESGTNGRPVGAFKVKLSVMAESEPACNPSLSPLISNPIYGKLAPKRLSQHLPATNLLSQSFSQPNEVSSTVQQHLKMPRKLSAPVLTPRSNFHSKIGPVQQPIRQSQRHTPTTRRPSSPRGRKNCASCTYRDYVNLSELENCCTHHQAYPGVHHIRHCDRHCNCPQSATQTPHPVRSPPKCAAYRPADCEHACIAGDSHCEPGTKQSSRARNIAYYASRQQLLVDQNNKENRPPTVCNPPSTHFFDGSSLHERKHKHRHKQRQRAMEQVREWILKDAALATIDIEPQPVLPSKDSRHIFVEHKHVHEHHHYVHAKT